MNRRLGIAVLLASLVAWRSQGSSTGVDAPAEDAASTQTAPESQTASGAGALDVGARLLVRYLGLREEPETTAKPEDQLSAPQQLARSLEQRFERPAILIATLPDPIASHLDWAFDSHLDALRRAFERAGYVVDRFELPWTRAGAGPPRLSGRPGAMLFRRAATQDESKDGAQAAAAGAQPKLWLVYLVGELSTGGIDRVAFDRALEERRWLLGFRAPPGRAESVPLAIVGPTFSGSSRSLHDALAGRGPCEVVSGGATSPKNREVVEGVGSAIHFRSTLHTDATLIEVLKREILGPLGVEDHWAILQESTTDYGQSTEESGVLTIPFPMSIGSLRRAIVKNDSNDKADAPAMPGRAARSSVDLELYAEPERAETALLASKLTPATVDLLLEEITRTLVQRDVSAVLLVASDVRDKLFLGSELKKRLPALQLFTTEGNALYLRPELNRWLRGMVVLSTYPMFLRDRSWRAQSQTAHELIVFPNEGAEGTFNAVLVQLGREDLVVDYGHPIRASQKNVEVPPVWATVVGAGTMLPLAVYDVGAQSNTPVALATKVPQTREVVDQSDHGFLAMLSTTVLAVFLLGNVVWRCLHDRAGGKDGERMTFADKLLRALPKEADEWKRRHVRIKQISLALHHELYVALLYASLWCLLLPNVTLIVLRRSYAADSLTPARVFGCVAVVVGLGALIRRAYRAYSIAVRFREEAFDHFVKGKWPDRLLRAEWWAEVGLRFGVVLVALGYIAANVLLVIQIVLLSFDDSRFLLFFHRSIEVDQGVSLLVPLMFLGVVLVAWCYWHLSRIRGLATSTPAEVLWHGATEDPELWTFGSRVRERLFRIVPTLEGLGLFLVLTVAFIWLVFQFAGTLDAIVLRAALDWPVFDMLLRVGIVAALAGSLWAGYRLIAVWQSFAQTLNENDVTIASVPFGAVKKDLDVRADLALWPVGNARNLAQLGQNAWRQLRDSLTPHEEQGPPIVDDSRAVFNHTTAKAVARVAEDHSQLRMERNGDAAKALEAMIHDLKRHPVAAKEEDKPAWRKAMDRVVAIEMLRYVEWTVRQMRHLAFFLLLSLVLTTLLISSYPYQPQQLIQTISLFVFASIVLLLVLLIGGMNRNAALSRMAVIAPGELTWDRTLFANLALYGLVPLITLISSQHAGLRDALFDWLKPLMSFLVKA